MADMFGIIVAGRLVSVSARNLDTIILRIDRWALILIKNLFKKTYSMFMLYVYGLSD